MSEYIYEVIYNTYDCWDEDKRVAVYLNEEKANQIADKLNKEYWNKRQPYYVVKTKINHLKINKEFYDE